MKTQDTIGKLHTETERDAIHIAVCPVVAAEHLLPGCQIGFVGDDQELVTVRTSQPLGIVDPFLRDTVKPNERFWMFLFPNTVTSLRHAWEHPKIAATVSEQQPEMLVPSMTRDEAEKWLKKFAGRWDFDYSDMLASAERACDGIEDYVTAEGKDLHGADDLGRDDEQKFWECMAVMLGRQIPKSVYENLVWTCHC